MAEQYALSAKACADATSDIRAQARVKNIQAIAQTPLSLDVRREHADRSSETVAALKGKLALFTDELAQLTDKLAHHADDLAQLRSDYEEHNRRWANYTTARVGALRRTLDAKDAEVAMWYKRFHDTQTRCEHLGEACEDLRVKNHHKTAQLLMAREDAEKWRVKYHEAMAVIHGAGATCGFQKLPAESKEASAKAAETKEKGAVADDDNKKAVAGCEGDSKSEEQWESVQKEQEDEPETDRCSWSTLSEDENDDNDNGQQQQQEQQEDLKDWEALSGDAASPTSDMQFEGIVDSGSVLRDTSPRSDAADHAADETDNHDHEDEHGYWSGAQSSTVFGDFEHANPTGTTPQGPLLMQWTMRQPLDVPAASSSSSSAAPMLPPLPQSPPAVAPVPPPQPYYGPSLFFYAPVTQHPFMPPRERGMNFPPTNTAYGEGFSSVPVPSQRTGDQNNGPSRAAVDPAELARKSALAQASKRVFEGDARSLNWG
ncbi:hypothetical protein F4778DRAFT_783757 [Xylariomycetidae sp. FL2044]|nr:hypothetical protein F4778DRAFT_783757 [Xylariomycetidae sp. FL2044]